MGLNFEKEMYQVGGQLYPCTTSITMGYIGGKWKMVILYHLKDGTRRYNELRKKMPSVTERTLSLQLKQLEQDGIIKREVHTLKPPLKVEYALTDFGKTLLPVMQAIADWGTMVAGQQAAIVSVPGN